MTKIIAVTNNKGGVAKTTTALNLAFGIGKTYPDAKVLLIDLDVQANLTSILPIPMRQTENNIYNAMLSKADLKIIPIKGNVYIAPAHIDMVNAEIELAAKIGSHMLLRDALEPIKDQFDYIIIDTSPSIGVLVYNAYSIADEIIIPTDAEFYSISGLDRILNTMDTIKRRLNPNISRVSILLTKFHRTHKLHNDIEKILREKYGDMVLKTVIRNNTDIAYAIAIMKDVFSCSPQSAGAKDYEALVSEYIS